MRLLTCATALLRDPVALIDDPDPRAALGRLAGPLLGITALGAGVFGAVVGSYRGGLQLFYAAVKMPALLLLPVVLSLPAIRAFLRASELEVSAPWVALAALAGTARAAILAAALGPVLWLYYSITPDYHAAVMAMVVGLGLAGLPGIGTVLRALPSGGSQRWLAAAGAAVILGLTTAQSGWLLRPFIARPTAEVAFLRPIESDIFSGLAHTASASVGVYSDWEAASGGLLYRAPPAQERSQVEAGTTSEETSADWSRGR